jgi:hypothetical protein
LKNTLRPNVKEKRTQKRAAHHSIPASGRELGRTVEKYQDQTQKKGITKEQHITLNAS